jgi:hypothetical protein
VLPLPAVSGVLTALRPLDLPTLERGMQQFLEQLERMGQHLTRPGDGTGLYAWAVAGAAAALACEIGRRHLRRPVDVPLLDLPPMRGWPLD